MIMEKSTKGILKKWHALAAIFFLAAFATNVQAQNVTIRPNNGSLITGQAGGNTQDSGIGRGMASMWRHEQLPLMMTTSDIANLTSAGELADPSCAIDVYNGNLIIGAGQTQTFMVVSLPKGYRITGYRLVLQPNISGTITLHQGKNSWAIGSNDQMSFYETPAWSSGTPYGGNTHSTSLECGDAIATATAADGSTVMENNNATNRAKEFVITRTSQSPDDMTNQLHFFFARASEQYAVTIKSFEIRFTAQGTFDADVTPSTAIGGAVSVAQSPFTTSKMDVGSIVKNATTGLYTYDYTGVRDLIANMWLYQSDAVNAAGEPAEGIATNKHIYPVEIDGKGAYAFGDGTYFVEPPTTIHTTSGWESPIGFRVVGAKFDCKWGTATEGGAQPIANACIIRGSYSTNNGQPRDGGYLNDHLDITNSEFVWQIDEFGNIYREYTDASNQKFRKYLACFGEGDERILSLSSAASGHEATWNLRVADDGRVYYKSDSNNYYYLNWRIIQEGGDWHSRCYVTKDYGQNLASATLSGSHDVTLNSFTPGEYTLKIYGTDKTTPVQTVTVSSADDPDAKIYPISNLNNDAVMFTIDVADGCQALVNVTLQLEALNPYINSMDIVCESQPDVQTGEKLELIQTFTANDFSVSGGKFIFYIPTDYNNKDLTFTFRDLYSSYGDESYGGTGNARYSYVTSPYFQAFDGYAGNATPIADAGYNMNDATDAGLYDNRYNPNAASKHKIYTGVAGNIRFKFNNAEDLVSGTENKYLQEYPFSVTKYIGSDDPDNTSKTGEFNTIIMNASNEDQKSGIYYVFTADETRYNIAPTTALEHRSFAFYRMDIELVAKNYIEDLKWDKIYGKTLYVDKEGKTQNKSMWGLTVKAKDTNASGQLVDPENGGYLSAMEILEAIEAAFETPSDDKPASKDQILYIDGSSMSTIISSAGYSLETLKKELATNAIIYLPETMTSTADNYAYKRGSGSSVSYLAGKDIVLTDKQPFFIPFDIQVDAAHMATYERLISKSTYGKVANASLVMPFELTVSSNGTHTNADNSSIVLHTMQANAALTQKDGKTYAYFPELTGVTKTTPNTPYMVKVNTNTAKEGSFIVSQTGTLLKATKGTNYDEEKYLLTGETASGVNAAEGDAAGTYTFTNKGTYAGMQVAKNDNVFYFAKDMFVSSKNLDEGYSYANIAPFRAFYATGNLSAGAKLMNFGIILGEGEGDVPTAIHAVDAASIIDVNAPVYDLQGRMVATSYRELNAKKLQRGFYVVNGVKFIVK